eukprot:Gb_27708 [translate_table: standard]
MGISIAHSDEHMESSALRISVENNDEISPLLMGNPRRSDAGQSIRGNGYPFKRVHSNGVDLNPYPTNGGNRELSQFGSKGKSHTIKPGRVEKSEGFGRKSRPWVYSILISFGIACFLAEALLQDSIMTFLRHSELPPSGSTGVDRPTLEQVKILEPSGIERTFYFGETIKFMPAKFLQNHNWAPNGRNNLSDAAQGKRHSIRSPQLALVCFDLSRSPGLLLLVSVAKGLQALGYDLELYSFGDGPMRAVWEKLGTPVNILQSGSQQVLTVDWLNFDGVLVNSLEAKSVISSLMQEPFKAVPVIWVIHEKGLGMRLGLYASSELTEIINDWKDTFHRADVVIFPDYTMPLLYSSLDSGNFFVIPGSPTETWEAEHFMATQKREDSRIQLGFNFYDFVIVVVGSPFVYKGMWLEHTLTMQAILPLMSEFYVGGGNATHLRLVIVSGNSTSTYGVALQAIALQLGFPSGSVQHVGVDGDVSVILSIADLVLYGSFREEQAFPSILVQAMSFEKPIIVPNLTIIQKYIADGKNGVLFPIGDVSIITKAVSLAISNGRLSPLAQKLALAGKEHARDLMASDAIVGYAAIIENVLQFPSESVLPRPASEIPEKVKTGWQWQLLMDSTESKVESLHHGLKKSSVVFQVEELWRIRRHMAEFVSNSSNKEDETFSLPEWDEERANEMAEHVERREAEELEERSDQPRGTWEDVYRSVKRAERTRDELHERDDGEMERSGQPLCIYEPYHGPGAWPFLHRNALYRGIGLVTEGRRAVADDIDGPARLPLLNDAYYRDVLCEYGAYFAIADKVDRIHKNSWIGFQSWRAAGRKVSLSKAAEKELTDAVRMGRHGHAVYFWARMDKDTRHGTQGNASQWEDFWSFCDAINAGNCRVVFSDAFKRMYNLPESWTAIPPMPFDGDSWSVLHSWAMPTSSFLEFVMFARMFVDSLDAQHYQEHHDNGTCPLSISKLENRYCYCRVLELLVNVWAYHSARRMVYVNPETGLMQEQHKMDNRRGHMWVKWFDFGLLKAMDEDLAEEADYEHPARRWIWPSTGEIFWQGIYEREHQHQHHLKMEKRRRSKEKLGRMRSRYRQKSLGKYMKPPPQEFANNIETKDWVA